jgi:hypothetical protein
MVAAVTIRKTPTEENSLWQRSHSHKSWRQFLLLIISCSWYR